VRWGSSERQVKRLKVGVRRHGPAALPHKNRGRKPKHALPETTRRLIVEVASGPYRGASCPHISELLAQGHDILVSPRTVHRVLAASSLNRARRRSPRRHRTRPRMPQEGLLVQCDASLHHWLEDRGLQCSLLGAVDDATSKILGLVFRPQEDLRGYLQLMHDVISRHGVPHTLYTDRHSIFFSAQRDNPTIEDQLAGTTPRSQFGHALDRLGIHHVASHSPQARGRIERLWGTLHQRLVVELRRAAISSLDDANAFLAGFIEHFNSSFAVLPEDPSPAFGPAPARADLLVALAFRDTRKASRASTISYRGQTYQLATEHGRVAALRPRDTVTVLTRLDGSLRALYGDKPYRLTPVPLPARPQAAPTPVPAPKTPYRPPAEHPWKSASYQAYLRRRAALSTTPGG